MLPKADVAWADVAWALVCLGSSPFVLSCFFRPANVQSSSFKLNNNFLEKLVKVLIKHYKRVLRGKQKRKNYKGSDTDKQQLQRLHLQVVCRDQLYYSLLSKHQPNLNTTVGLNTNDFAYTPPGVYIIPPILISFHDNFTFKLGKFKMFRGGQ